MPGASFSIGFDAIEPRVMLKGIAARVRDLTPAMHAIGEIAVAQAHEAFETGTAPGGAAWPPSLRAARENGQTLMRTRRLFNSIGHVASSDRSEIGTPLDYAPAHQFGARIPAHVILPVHGKALAWPGGGHPVRKVNHPGADIPARPFLPDEDTLDWPEVHDALIQFITGGPHGA